MMGDAFGGAKKKEEDTSGVDGKDGKGRSALSAPVVDGFRVRSHLFFFCFITLGSRVE